MKSSIIIKKIRTNFFAISVSKIKTHSSIKGINETNKQSEIKVNGEHPLRLIPYCHK